MADEEDGALPNDGSLVPFPALMMIYEGFFPCTPLPTHGKTQEKTKTSKLSIKTLLCNYWTLSAISVCMCFVVVLICVFVGALKSSLQG